MNDASQIRRVGIIGAGTMGAQIASLVAMSGRDVLLYDVSSQALAKGIERARSEVMPAIEASGLVSSSADSKTDRLQAAGSLAEAAADADLVIEAVKESLEVKRTLFSELSPMSPAILATNSSSIASSAIAPMVERPERFLNMHFFAPIWVRSMLEVMSCGHTSVETMEAAQQFGRSLGLVTAAVHGESKGFIINRIWRAVKRESLRVVDEGVASPEDVDRLWMIFFQTEYAPFGIMDMVGLDVVSDIETSYQRETQDPTDLPSPMLKAMIDRGLLGEKTGQGFYSHPNPAYTQPGFLTGSIRQAPVSKHLRRR